MKKWGDNTNFKNYAILYVILYEQRSKNKFENLPEQKQQALGNKKLVTDPFVIYLM